MKTGLPQSTAGQRWFRLLLWALAVNAVWEWVQCALLYDMKGSPMGKGTEWMVVATVVDAFIVLAVVGLASWIAGKHQVTTPDARGWVALIGVGLAAGILLEWLARVLNLWNYGPLMPTLPVMGVTVGLAPIVQVVVLPALSVVLAMRRKL